MKKMDIMGNLEHYDQNMEWTDENLDKWIPDGSDSINTKTKNEPNLQCDCGSTTFKVCWWDYIGTGGYCRIVCSNCGNDMVLIDDYN